MRLKRLLIIEATIIALFGVLLAAYLLTARQVRLSGASPPRPPAWAVDES